MSFIHLIYFIIDIVIMYKKNYFKNQCLKLTRGILFLTFMSCEISENEKINIKIYSYVTIKGIKINLMSIKLF